MTAPAQAMNGAGQNARPVIYGHRGARGEAPENTMVGFRHLAGIGINAVELDVQNAADHVPVIHHDPRVAEHIARDDTGAWIAQTGPKLVETTYTDLGRYDVGELKPGTDYQVRFSDQIAREGERIPKLDDFFGWLHAQPDMTANLEIKSFANRHDLGDAPDQLARSAIQAARNHDVVDRIIISSFDWRVLSACKEIAPAVRRGYLSYLDRPNPPMQPNIFAGSPWMDGEEWPDATGNLPGIVADLGGAIWAPHFGDLTVDALASAHDLGLAVNVWTVNKPHDIRRMAEMGVDGIITDFPSRALEVLGEELSESRTGSAIR